MQQSTQQMGEWKERGGWNTSVSAHRFAEDVAILKVVVAELPVGGPHGAIEVKGVEDAKERVPEIFVREGLVRQRAGPADLHRDVVVGRQGQQLWQIGERLRGGRRLVWLWQAAVVMNCGISAAFTPADPAEPAGSPKVRENRRRPKSDCPGCARSREALRTDLR